MTRGQFLDRTETLRSLRKSIHQLHRTSCMAHRDDRAEMDAALADLRRAEARLLAQLERANRMEPYPMLNRGEA